MEKLNDLYTEIKPFLHAFAFELKFHKRAFYAYTLISVGLYLLPSIIGVIAYPEMPLPDTKQALFLRDGLGFMGLFMIFGCCYFFSGIICSEFKTKSGYITFPKINKYKLIFGKYFGNLALFVGSMAIYYFVNGLIGLYYYGGPINIRYYYSFGFAVLYILAVSSFVTFFSSFMKSVNMTIVATILILMIGFSIVSQFITLAYPEIEPLYSLEYVSRIITEILNENYPTDLEDRYMEIKMESFTFRTWLIPTLEMGITVMLIYWVTCFTAASLIFSRKQL